MPLSGVAGQCEIPPVHTRAMRSGTASAARRSASPKAQARASGVSGGPWQLMFAGMMVSSFCGIQEMQRHHDAVVETPFFGIGDIDGFLDFADQPPGQTGIARAHDGGECEAMSDPR